MASLRARSIGESARLAFFPFAFHGTGMSILPGPFGDTAEVQRVVTVKPNMRHRWMKLYGSELGLMSRYPGGAPASM